MAKVFMLESNSILNKDLLRSVLESGHSRIPVYQSERTNIVGLILTKDLLNYSLDDEVPIHCMKMRHLPTLKATTPMYDMLKLFQTGRSHMAVLTQPEVPEAVANLALKADRKKTKEGGPGIVSVPAPAPLRDGAVKDKSILSGGAGLTPVPEVYTKTSFVEPSSDAMQPAPFIALEVSENELGENVALLNKKESNSMFRRLSSVLTPKKVMDEEDEEEKKEGEDVPTMTIVPQIAKPGEVIGITTIEDVLEELMGMEILDETDRFADNEQTEPVNDAVKGAMMRDLDDSLRAHLAVTGQLVKMSRRSMS